MTATLSLVLVITGGVAIAAGVPRNSVGPAQIKKDAVRGPDVKNDSLTGADVDESTLSGIEGPSGPQGPAGPAGEAGPQGSPGLSDGPAGGDLTGSYPNPLIAADAVGGAEVAPDSLTGADISEASLGAVPNATLFGGLALNDVRPRSQSNSLNPADHGLTASDAQTAYSGAFQLPASAQTEWQVLAVASIDLYNAAAVAAGASCKLTYSVAGDLSQRAYVDFPAVAGFDQQLTLVGGATVNSSFATSVFVECKEESGEVMYDRGDVWVLAVPA